MFITWDYRPRQRGTPETNKIRELDGGQIVFVLSVEGIVTLKLAFSPTLDTVPSPPYRACYHSLLRLKDAYDPGLLWPMVSAWGKWIRVFVHDRGLQAN